MSFWKRIRHLWTGDVLPEEYLAVNLSLQEWVEQTPERDLRIWVDPSGDVLSLGMPSAVPDLPNFSDKPALRQWSRSFAESQAAGLIEVNAGNSSLGKFASLIYKKLRIHAYVFTGMLFAPEVNHIWTVVAGEHGTTGVREAVVTAELFAAGKLTIQDYQQSWACDPYDPSYSGVDKRTLRFISDDECYDERFPDHPLSKVRQVLGDLPNSVRIDLSAPDSVN